jgi:hypothetical protein
MRNILFGAAMLTFLAGCSASASETTNADIVLKKDATDQIAVVVHPNRILSVEIDGMVCEMGCGGSIRKGLNGTNGVANCSFDYEDGRTTNNAKIEFDKDVISADEITTLISELNDGQFTVGKSSAVAFTKADTAPISTNKTDTKGSGADQTAPINMSSSTDFKMPNILDLLSGLLSR